MGNMLAIIAGLIWMASGGVLLEISRLLGPAFNKTHTVNSFWRGLAWVGAVIFFVRGVTLLFPGQLIETTGISFVAPLSALAALGVTVALLDWIMRDRSPPPWSTVATVQLLRLMALLGRTGPLMKAARALPPAGVGDLPPDAEPQGERRWRLLVLFGAVLIALGIFAFIAANAATGQP